MLLLLFLIKYYKALLLLFIILNEFLYKVIISTSSYIKVVGEPSIKTS
jgi:hypothetical protein